jgi:hypothetical protein
MLNRAFITLCLICISQIQSFAQVLGIPLYSWDFSGGLPTTWTNGSTSNIGVWEYRGPSTVPSNAITSRGSCSGGSSAFNSVSQSNGFMIFDSNYWDDNDNQCGGFGTGPDPGPHTAWLISNSFALTGVTGAVVTYQQQFRNYSSTVKVQYSINNGTTWVDMLSQSDFPGATAEWKSATFPAAAIGQANVKLRFLFSGSYYHWAIDDITVFKPSINNLSLNNTRYTTFGNTTPVPPNDFHDLPYDRYPKTMIVPFKFSGKATNIGSASQTNSNLNVKVLNAANTALYNQTSANATVTAGNTATYTLTTGYTPSTTTGYFRIAYQVNQTQTDESPNNNKDTLDYYITDYQYARDEGPMEDEFTPSAFYAGQTHQVGNIFEGRSNTVKCTSIAVAVGPGTSIGTTIRARIYRTDFTNLQATSVVYPVNAWDINTIGQQKLITLQLPTPLTLINDSIYIVMVENTVGTQAFKVCRSGAAIDQTSFVRYPDSNGLFFMAKMPIVRMNLFTAAQTPGCMNPLANNYLASATIDDGSCDIPGCIYASSSNYNPNATWYDGSCLVYGCTLTTACNYSAIATVNDGSCIMPVTYYADADADGFGNSAVSQSSCTVPAGYITNSTDCNDNNANVRPTATEICNTIDDNCNGQINEGITFTTYYADADGDGFGNPSVSQSSCSPITGFIVNNTDCNDASALIKPTAIEICNAVDDNCNGLINEGLVFVNYYIDTDIDGYGAGTAQSSCIPLGNNYVTNNLDCNNFNANIRPNATELCNGLDDNCNSLIDDGLTFLTYYVDTDTDGFGAGSGTISCSNPGAGYVTNNTDCNNNNSNIRPNAIEICNGIDDNCNTLIDDGITFLNYYIDTDGDTYGAGAATNACASPGVGYVTNNLDCNNTNAAIRPGAVEICNSIDDNCNNSIDEGLTFVNYYIDTDSDGFGAGTATNTCSNPGLGFVTNNTDCNNNDSNIRPNAIEICNAIDDNCNGLINEGIVFLTYYFDADQDGYYLSSINACSSPGINYTTSGVALGDCNDANANVHVGAIEICGNGIDEDCNGIDPTCIIPGCTNPIASNFNPLANLENGTCIIFGCLDPLADNYNPQANTNNQSCIYFGCTDPFANNFDPSANTDDFSCEYNTASIIITEHHFCAQDTVTAYNQTQYSSLDSCIVDFGDGTVFNYCSPSYAHVYATSGNYAVQLTLIQGTQTSISITDTIIVAPLPSLNGLDFSYPFITLNTDTTNSVHWLFNQEFTNFVGNSIDPSTDYSTDGFYQALVMNESGCILYSDSIYFVIPTYQATQNSTCGPNDVIFENTTVASQILNCHFENSNDPGNYYSSPYTHSMGAPENFAVVEICSVFGNNYYSLNNPIFESYPIPETPVLNYNAYVVQVSNSNGNNIQWFLNGDPLNVSSSAQSISTYFNNNLQNGNYAAVYTNQYGCISDTGSIFVMEINATATVSSGCSPLSTAFTNNTSMAAGIQCEILLPGQGYVPIDAILDFTFNDPGIYQPTLHCYSGSFSNTYILDPITVFSHPTPPVLLSSYGQVSATNNSFGNNIAWSLDGNNLNSSTNTISTFINGIFENGYYAATYTDANGCATTSAPLLVIQPNYNVVVGEGCAPLAAVLSNTTDPVIGMTCSIADGLGGASTPFDAIAQLTYLDAGNFAPEMTCSVGSVFGTYSDTVLTVFSHPTPPILTSSYGQVDAINNALGNNIAWSLDGNLLNSTTNSISTFINGILENGYYFATYTDANGCETTSEPLLVIQPNYSAVVGEGCGPLLAVLTNTTDPVDGMTCVIFDGLVGQNFPLNSTADLTYASAGSFAPEMSCYVGNDYGTFSDTVITVYPNPAPALLTYNNGLINAVDLPQASSIVWTLNGSPLNNNSNPLDIGANNLSGYFFGTITNEFGCSSQTDSLLQIFPSFTLSSSEGCGPLSILATNTSPQFNGMSCLLQTNGIDYALNSTASLNYSTDGGYTTSIACTLDGETFTANGPNVTVFPNAPTPQLSSAYGAVLCSNCSSLITQYFLDNTAFAQGGSVVGTFQSGVYQNGYYTAQSVSAQGCLSQLSAPILVIQPSFNFTPTEGCAPLLATFVNTTDYIPGLSCELFLGNGNGNIPLSYLETYDFNYTSANTYSPYLTCSLGNSSANSPVSSIIVNGGTTPQLLFENGFVTCSNCANQDNVTWIIDGTLTVDSVISVSDTLGQFFSCDYLNEFGCTANSFLASTFEEINTSFTLYPNPAQEILNIAGLQPSSTLEIRDTQGRLIFRESGAGKSRTINTAYFSNGMYTITETSNKLTRSGTLLVNH